MEDLPSFAQALLKRKSERENLVQKSGGDSMISVSTTEQPKITKFVDFMSIESATDVHNRSEKQYNNDSSEASYCDSDDEALIKELNKYRKENKELKDEIKMLRMKLMESVDSQEIEDLRTENFELRDMIQREKSKRTIAEEKLKYLTDELKLKDQENIANRKIISTLQLNLDRANNQIKNMKIKDIPEYSHDPNKIRDLRPYQINPQTREPERNIQQFTPQKSVNDEFEVRSPDKMSTSAIQRELNEIIPKKDRLASQIINEYGDQGGAPDENVRRELYDIRRRIGQLQLQLKFRGVMK